MSAAPVQAGKQDRVVCDLVRAAYSHRAIISAGRLAEYNALQQQIDTTLVTALFELSRLDKAVLKRGTIKTCHDGVQQPAGTVATAIVNMTVVYVSKTFGYIAEQIQQNGIDIHGVFKLFPTYRERLAKAILLVKPLAACNRQHGFIIERHWDDLLRTKQDLVRLIGPKQAAHYGVA